MKPGFAFGDHIKLEKTNRRHYKEEGEQPLRSRGWLLPIILFIVAGLIIIKLFSLQLLQGVQYRKLADSNRTRTLTIHAPRGVIFDRNGVPLVYNMPGFLQVQKDASGKVIKTIHLSHDEALALIAKGDRIIEVDSLRQYPFKDSMSHVLGYIGQISEEEFKTPAYADYLSTDWIGKSGIEKQYESLLRGVDGKELIEVDALGKAVRPLGQTDPLPGQNITLTIDSKLQQAVFESAKDIKKGAVIVSKPDGELLAMVSKPSFDPNLFTLDSTYQVSSDSAYSTVDSIINDNNNQPFLNRAIAGTYPPGSTFKIVTAASGLEQKVIDDNYKIVDTGVVKLGDFSFANWYYTQYGRTEPGELDVTRALARSNDIFFYKLAEKIGVDKLAETAKLFGIGNKLDIDLTGEASGIVPNKQWKKEVMKEDWYLGDTYHYGIGQGFLLTTPLQVNAWTQVIANGGTLFEPRLLENRNQVVKAQNLINQQNRELIREGMIEACSTGGVAWPLFDFAVKNPKLKIDGKNITQAASKSAEMRHIAIACKTGTAQHGGEDTLPHAWITLFAPAYNPQIVITVLVESAGEGSSVAGPIAKKILETYFSVITN